MMTTMMTDVSFRFAGTKSEFDISKLNDGELFYLQDTDELYCIINGEKVLISSGYLDENYTAKVKPSYVRCEYCGTKNHADDFHCHACGAPL